MDEPTPQIRRTHGRRRRELIMRRSFERERVEGTLWAAAYEAVWSPGASARGDRLELARRHASDGVGNGAAARHARRRAKTSLAFGG